MICNVIRQKKVVFTVSRPALSNPSLAPPLPRLVIFFPTFSNKIHFEKTAIRCNINFLFLQSIYEPTHEIMALIVLRKLNLQTRMRSNPLGTHVCFLVRPFFYFHTLCVRIAKALTRLCGCAVSPEPSLFVCAISTIIS